MTMDATDMTGNAVHGAIRSIDAAVQPLLILGTRPYALVVADLVSAIEGYRVAGFVENMDRQRCNERLGGMPIYWIDELAELAQDHVAVCSLATTRRNQFIQQARDQGLRFATLVHPSAHISDRSTLGEGTRVEVGSIIAAFTDVGRHVAINRGATIGHHNRIGDFVTIHPGVNIAGHCRIGDRTFIGIGANIIDGIRIGTQAVIGAGAVVAKDVPDRVQVVGVPARIVKQNIEGK